MRPVFDWHVGSRHIRLGERTLVMGVINVTPDSFSDGGSSFEPAAAVDHSMRLLAEGADILDVGGESTRPSSQPVSSEEEIRRVIPVIEGIAKHAPDALISIDTYKSETARAALAAGAWIVNDVSGATWDEAMLPTLAQSNCGCVLMHTRGRPQQWKSQAPLAPEEVVPLVKRELRAIADHAVASGVSRERIVLDPGFGFGKRLDENFPLLAHLGELRELGFPILSGTSRKSFIGKAAAPKGASTAESLAATIATVTASVLQGAHIVRVHDVAAAVAAVGVADAILKARGV